MKCSVWTGGYGGDTHGATRMSDDDLRPRVEFRVREHTPAGVYERQRSVCERLQRLRRAGKVADVSVAVGGKQAPARPETGSNEIDDRARSIRETYRAFEAWASRSGCALTPAFDTRECGTLVSDEQHEVIVFPMMYLALYLGDEVRAVFPHSTDDGIRTVEDGLAAIAADGWGDNHALDTCISD